MSAWSQAVWTVNQIKDQMNKSYDTQINTLATSYGQLVNDFSDSYENMTTSLILTSAPAGTQASLAPGCLAFIVEE